MATLVAHRTSAPTSVAHLPCDSVSKRDNRDEILLSYIYTTHPATPYYGHNYYRRSGDEGQTFGHFRNIASDPEEDFGCQCIEFLDDNLAVLAYHCRDGLRVARIPIDWFYGK